MADDDKPKANPPGYKTDPNMASAMGGAHRKPASKSGVPPSVMRHIAFWMPDIEPPAGSPYTPLSSTIICESPYETARSNWVSEIELYLLSIYDLFCDLHAKDPASPHPTITNMMEQRLREPASAGDAPAVEIPDTIGLLNHVVPRQRAERGAVANWQPIQGKTRHEMVRISGTWDTMPTEICAELHAEYFTLSIRIELAHRSMQPGGPEQTEPVEVPRQSVDSTRHYAAVTQALNDINHVLSARSNAIHWGTNASSRKGSDRLALTRSYRALYQDIWTGLRDEIIESPATSAVNRARLGLVFADFRGLLLRIGTDNQYIELNNPKADPRRSAPPILRDLIGDRFDSKALIHHTDVLFPFLLANPLLTGKTSEQPAFEELEHTFTGLQNGRCLYASSLISQNPDPGNLAISPLNYVVLASHGERWQLGRLIDRLHVMGALRLAAIRGLHEVSKANGRLRSLEIELDRLEEGFVSTLTQEDGCKILSEKILDISSRFSKATAAIPGNIGYRSERSRYYLEQLNGLLDRLRIHQIETFQTYPNLVRRRMGAAFDSIRLTGSRSTRIQERLRGLHFRLEAANASKHQKDLAIIQETAEKFFFLVVLPYYLYGFWRPFVAELRGRGSSGGSFDGFVFGFAITLGLCLWKRKAITSLRQDLSNKQARQRRFQDARSALVCRAEAVTKWFAKHFTTRAGPPPA